MEDVRFHSVSTSEAIFSHSSNGMLDLRYTTIAHNQMLFGGVDVLGVASANFRGALLANNGPRNCSGALDSAGHNLSDDGSCPSFVAAGDLQNVAPEVLAAGEHGGLTPTCPLMPGSPAIDAAGTLECPATDQRGVTRPQAIGTVACDIGAYEREP